VGAFSLLSVIPRLDRGIQCSRALVFLDRLVKPDDDKREGPDDDKTTLVDNGWRAATKSICLLVQAF
jgi:hypothetical protein